MNITDYISELTVTEKFFLYMEWNLRRTEFLSMMIHHLKTALMNDLIPITASFPPKPLLRHYNIGVLIILNTTDFYDWNFIPFYRISYKVGQVFGFFLKQPVKCTDYWKIIYQNRNKDSIVKQQFFS